MEKLVFTDLKTSNKKIHILEDIFLALSLSAGIFLCLKDMFGFNYGAGDAFSGSVSGGLVYTWNLIADALGNSDFIILKHFADESGSNGLFLTIAIIIIAVISYFIIRQKNAWGILILVFPIGLINFLFEVSIRSVSVSWLILSAFLAVLYMKNNGEGFLQNIIIVVLMGMLIYSAFQLPFMDSYTSRPDFVKNFKDTSYDKLSAVFYGENPLRNGSLDERTRNKDEGIALKINMEKPQSVYLRGYVGDKYTNKGWENLDNSLYYSVLNQMNWFEKTGFNTVGQLGLAGSLTNNKYEYNKTSIECIDADSRFAYIPYETANLNEDMTVKGGSYVASGPLKKYKEYSYKTGTSATDKWTDIAGKIYTEAGNNKTEKEALNNYFKDESHYNNYIYNNYTEVALSEKIILKKYFGKAESGDKGHTDYKLAIKRIKKYFDDNFIYTENLGRIQEKGPKGLEEFLKSNKGYDVQYATAATLMFRYMGIPARYVEGYLVTPEDASKMKPDEDFEIPLDRAHAWVEIYIDGTGFVPVEVCSEFYGVMKEADMKIGISNDALLQHHEPPDNNSSNSSDDNKNNGGDNNSHLNIKWLLLMLIPLGIIVFAIISFIAKLIMAIYASIKLHVSFKKDEPKKAVSAIYGYVENKNYFITNELRDLGNKAAYSNKSITEEDRTNMLNEMKKAKKITAEIRKNKNKQ